MAKIDEMVAQEGRNIDLTWIKALIWRWFEENKDAEVLTVHFWIFSKSVKLSDAKHIFELFLGPEPTIAAS